MTRPLLRLLAVCVLLAAACGGGADSTTVAPATTAAPATTSVAPATTTTAPAPTAALTVELAEYLSVVYSALADLLDDQNALAAGSAQATDLAEPWRDMSSQFSGVDPPPEAADFHQSWVALSADMLEISEEFADSGADRVALSIYLAAINSLSGEFIELDRQQIALASTVFEGRSDDLATYLTEVLQLQERGAPIAETMFGALGELGTDPQGAARTIFASATDMEAIGEGWSELDPPPEAADLHRRQVELLDRIVATFTELGEAIDDDVDPRPSLSTELNELSFLSPELNAAWTRFIGEALVR